MAILRPPTIPRSIDYKQGRAEKEVLVGILAHVIMAAAHDHEGSFASQIRKSEHEHFGPAADA